MKNPKIGFIGGGNMGGAIMKIWRKGWAARVCSSMLGAKRRLYAKSAA